MAAARVTAGDLETDRQTDWWGTCYLDAPIAGRNLHGADGGERSDTLERYQADPAPIAEAMLVAEARRSEARELLTTLTDRERRILLARFGEDERTLQDVGNEFGVSRERIRQIEGEALAKLRQRMERDEGSEG